MRGSLKRRKHQLLQQFFYRSLPKTTISGIIGNSNVSKVSNYKAKATLENSLLLLVCIYFILKIGCNIDNVKVQTEICVCAKCHYL